MRTKRKRLGVEWVGGLISMPAYVTGEGEPYRPEMLVWMSDQGLVLGSTVGKPGEVLAQACESLQGAMAHPMIGRPHSPEQIRVDSPELRDALRAGYPALDIEWGPTPEIDDLVAAMREKLEDGTGLVQSYLSNDVGPAAVAAFFRAAAALYRAKPWAIVPSDQDLISVTIEALEVSGAWDRNDPEIRSLLGRFHRAMEVWLYFTEQVYHSWAHGGSNGGGGGSAATWSYDTASGWNLPLTRDLWFEVLAPKFGL